MMMLGMNSLRNTIFWVKFKKAGNIKYQLSKSENTVNHV